ncbi:hypothetical protein J4H86_08990 [Spiractinospora alimapuensis]|uniref:alpha/beta hydrolase family protein n=1 Tax=Spiractinospora alimapuensis TaxID=2820884 RepID=UPI001F38EDC6|nr:hypothetical protein J4H86_08990 [Spiractinospora alimapuensis]
MRHARVDMSQWMADADDALTHLAAETEGAPLTWLGHSLGGKFLPFADHTRLTKAITVVAGSAYWRMLPTRIRWLTPPVLTVAAPIAMRALGYCPGAWLGLGNDIPAPAMRQWSRWCFDPDYMVGGMGGQERAAAVRVPITAVSFSDDEMITREGCESVHRWFVNSDVTRLHYTPEELGVSRLGHFGLFRSRNRELWDAMFLPHLPAE